MDNKPFDQWFCCNNNLHRHLVLRRKSCCSLYQTSLDDMFFGPLFYCSSNFLLSYSVFYNILCNYLHTSFYDRFSYPLSYYNHNVTCFSSHKNDCSFDQTSSNGKPLNQFVCHRNNVPRIYLGSCNMYHNSLHTSTDDKSFFLLHRYMNNAHFAFLCNKHHN